MGIVGEYRLEEGREQNKTCHSLAADSACSPDSDVGSAAHLRAFMLSAHTAWLRARHTTACSKEDVLRATRGKEGWGGYGADTGAEEWKDASASATDAAAAGDGGASGPGYTDKIKSAAAGTTEYGKQLASTVYEKVTGVGTAVAGKVQQATKSAGTATPGVAQPRDATAAADTPGTGGQQDKGVTVTGYIAEKLRPGDEDRALSEAISSAVQQRKEYVGGTVAQRVPAPGQVITKAREAVTSLTGGNRVSETVQPSTATGEEVKEGYATEAPVIRGEEIGDARPLNTNTM